MGWLIALAVLVLLASIPLGVQVQYDSSGFVLRIIAGFLRFVVIPFPKRKKKPKKEPAQSAPKKEAKPAQAPPPAEKKGGRLQDFLPFVRVLLDFMNQFRKKLRINHLQLKLILAGEDPCDLAVNYGRAWAALGNLMPTLERYFVIGKRDCEVECDFTASETLVTARLDLSITLGRLLGLAAVYGIRGLKEFLNLPGRDKRGRI